MSSTMVFVFGMLSLSISALATSRISKRRANRREARIRTRPLILPWLVSGDSATRKWSEGNPKNYPITIDFPSKPQSKLDHANHAKLFTSQTVDSSYIYETSAPRIIDGGRKNNLSMYSPIEPIDLPPQSPPPSHYHAQEQSFSQEIVPSRLEFNILASKNVSDSNSNHMLQSKCHSLSARDSMFSNRDSISSISSTVYSRNRDSVFGDDESQKLEFVIGFGHRLQAQYGTLNSPRSQFQVPVLTPIERVYQIE